MTVMMKTAPRPRRDSCDAVAGAPSAAYISRLAKERLIAIEIAMAIVRAAPCQTTNSGFSLSEVRFNSRLDCIGSS